MNVLGVIATLMSVRVFCGAETSGDSDGVSQLSVGKSSQRSDGRGNGVRGKLPPSYDTAGRGCIRGQWSPPCALLHPRVGICVLPPCGNSS